MFPMSSSKPMKALQTAVSREGERERIMTAPISSATRPAPQRRDWARAASGSVSATDAIPTAQSQRDSVSSILSMENIRASTVPQRNMAQGTRMASRERVWFPYCNAGTRKSRAASKMTAPVNRKRADDFCLLIRSSPPSSGQHAGGAEPVRSAEAAPVWPVQAGMLQAWADRVLIQAGEQQADPEPADQRQEEPASFRPRQEEPAQAAEPRRLRSEQIPVYKV